MAKYNSNWNEKKIAKYLKEGRGQNRGKDYIPWIQVQDFPSRGRVSRVKGWKTERVHHFLSDLELSYFYLLEWSDFVIDVREQFPLKREETYAISKDKEIKHSTNDENDTPMVMTTDFLINRLENGKDVTYARTVKPSKELEDNRTIEKLEIERQYWEDYGIEWGIITEKEIPIEIVKNIKWIHSSYYIDESINPEGLRRLMEELKLLLRIKERTVIEVLDFFGQEYNLERGTSLSYLHHLIARKEVIIDMNMPFRVTSSIKDSILTIKQYEERDKIALY
ncbi:heteromeric transposase endonuclease subunit TnsA [Guptibacillus hwajinpoensis]|uniref:Tn7 transposition protein A n=1 Tax=Guptibacillus hwajinpoensis TaxID=208199 RepID=A0A0J6FPU1_9BACL|nr:heteromeric transposase endonuclease subunit TnsA [Alkalihalobacillus macyae]KMM36357.1 hypothetical protein AB986_18125 [Alkalihalobacillus macyae]